MIEQFEVDETFGDDLVFSDESTFSFLEKGTRRMFASGELNSHMS
jgi:hypothetical protein